jgi:sugar lactone lactonase YvrE
MAQAARSHPFVAKLLESGRGPSGVGVDDALGNVFIAEAGSNTVQIVGPEGEAPIGIPRQALQGFEFGVEPTGVAVDNATGSPSKGDVYVADVFHNAVKKYALNPTTKAYELGEELVASPALGEPLGVGVDAEGDVWVADYGSASVVEFGPTGTELDRINVSSFVGHPSSVAFDSRGDLFVQSYDGGSVWKYGANGAGEVEPSTTPTRIVSAGGTGIAVDPTTNSLYVAMGDRVAQYDALTGAAEPQYDFGAGVLSKTERVAVNAQDGLIYVSNREGGFFGERFVAAFGPLVTPIRATTGEASEVGATGATLVGTVDPEGAAVVECAFEYGADASYGHVAPCAQTPAQIGEGEGAVAVSARLDGLQTGSTYHYRLVARNAEKASYGADRTFRPAALIPPSELAPCANEALRYGPGRSLGDCRAYEQVSPVDKNGNNVAAAINGSRAALGGDYMTFFSAGGIPGGVGEQDYPSYVGGRSADAWATQGLFPPPSYGRQARLAGYSPDLALAFVTAAPGWSNEPGVETLYARDTATAALTKIAAPPASVAAPPVFQVAGTSEDDEFVLFEANSRMAGVAAGLEGHSNVYLWDRSRGAIVAAGVLNDGDVPPKGAFAGPYAWFESPRLEVGGSAAGYYTADGNALGGGGSAVWFTAAGSGKLYVRLNPAAPQSAMSAGKCTEVGKACTLEVSASQKTNGSGPDGTASNGPAPAAFQSATRDGSRVYFTSSEELTNDANTGPEPPAPEIGRAAIGGGGVEKGLVPTRARWLALNGSHIYWTDPAGGTIGRASLDGSGVEEEFISGLDEPEGIAVDGSHVYWAEARGGDAGEGTIGRAALDGSGVEKEFITGASDPQGVAVLDEPGKEHLYWANAGTTDIGRAELDGGGAEQAFKDLLEAEVPEGVAVNSGEVFWSVQEGGASYLVRADNEDGSGETYAEVGGPVADLFVEGSHVYWSRPSAGALGRANLGFGEQEPEFVTGLEGPVGVSADAAHIYWSANAQPAASPGSDLYRYEPAGEHLLDITPDLSDPAGADVLGVLGTSEDGSYVYFAANGVLAAGAQPGNCDNHLGAGECSLYMWHEGAGGHGSITLVARLDNAGGQISDGLDWVPTDQAGNQQERTSRVSSDGRFLLFRSRSRLTTYDNEGTPELYRYDAATGVIVCVSCDPGGSAPIGAPSLEVRHNSSGAVGSDAAAALTRNLSADGDRVFFNTSDPLLSSDTNGVEDAYEWEADGTGSCHGATQNGGCLYLLSSGRAAAPSSFIDASASGSDAFLLTEQPLVGRDRDGLADVYDARVEGGLATQDPTPPVSCEGEGCRQAGTLQGQGRSAGSSSFSGPPNPKRPQRKHHKRHTRHHGKHGKHHKKKDKNNKKHLRKAGRQSR